MATAGYTQERPTEGLPTLSRGGSDPWKNDFVLLNLSTWWIRATRPWSVESSSEVAAVMTELREELS
ncbi:MAG: hypothetical protein WD904_07275 [Dehalococcoidia bacterium]